MVEAEGNSYAHVCESSAQYNRHNRNRASEGGDEEWGAHMGRTLNNRLLPSLRLHLDFLLLVVYYSRTFFFFNKNIICSESLWSLRTVPSPSQNQLMVPSAYGKVAVSIRSPRGPTFNPTRLQDWTIPAWLPPWQGTAEPVLLPPSRIPWC